MKFCQVIEYNKINVLSRRICHAEKGLGTVSSPYFAYDFSRKMLLMLYSIN